MKILAIDPGTNKTGVARLDYEADNIDLILVIPGEKIARWLEQYIDEIPLEESEEHVIAIEGWEEKFWETGSRAIKHGPAIAKLIEELVAIPQRNRNIRVWVQMSTTVSRQITAKDATAYLKAKKIKPPDNNHSIDAVKHALYAGGQWGLIRASRNMRSSRCSRRTQHGETQGNH